MVSDYQVSLHVRLLLLSKHCKDCAESLYAVTLPTLCTWKFNTHLQEHVAEVPAVIASLLARSGSLDSVSVMQALLVVCRYSKSVRREVANDATLIRVLVGEDRVRAEVMLGG